MKLKDFDEIIDTMAATPNCDFVQALLIMNNAPTVDAVPVVRCKDCVTHWMPLPKPPSHMGGK